MFLPGLPACGSLCLHPSTDRTLARQAPVPEVPVSLLIVQGQLVLRLAQRVLPQTPLLLLLVHPPCFHFPFFAVVQEWLFVPVIHELSVRTAPSIVVFASARRQFAGRARTK